VHTVGLGQHDSCPVVATVACSDIWNEHAATAWSHTIHPPYRPRSTSATSPPHSETQRDPSRPADLVGYRPVTRVVRIHIATRSRRYVQRQPSHTWPSRRPRPSTHPLSSILEKTVQLSNIEPVLETQTTCRIIGCQGFSQIWATSDWLPT
jgi:hypothetical protein